MKARTVISGALIGCVALLIAASPALGAKKPVKLGKVVTATGTATSVGDSNPITSTATCPSNKKVVGGGWTITQVGSGIFSIVNVFKSLRGSGESWTTTANTGTTAGIVLTTYAYCRNVKKAIVEVISTATTPTGQGAQTTTLAKCASSKQKLIAGGFESSQGNLASRVSYPIASFNAGGAWTYTAQNNTSGASQTLTVHAYCLKGIKSPSVKSASAAQTTPPNSPLSVSSPECTKKKPRLGAGGFNNITGLGGVPFPIENRANGKSWLHTTYNIAVSQLTSITSQGICLQK